jgi:hypothetical protein
MATYYVRVDGSDSNTGLGSGIAQAWQTITKAIGATGIAPGDTLYIAPGIYRGVFTAAFTNPSSNAQRITIEGNPSASQFSGVTAGPVIITNYTSNTAYTTGIVLTCDKDFVTLRNLCFCADVPGAPPYYGSLSSTSTYMIVDKCLFWQPSSNLIKYGCLFNIKAGTQGPTVTNSVFVNSILNLSGGAHSGQWDSQTVVTDCVLISNMSNGNGNDAIQLYSITASQYGGIKITNCFMQAANGVHILNALSPTSLTYIQNCYIEASNICVYANVSQTSNVLQSYNILNGSTTVTNVATNVTTKTNVFNPINAAISKIQGWADYPFISPLVSSQTAINAGVNTYSPAADIFGTTWLAPTTPTIGASEYQSYTPSSQYLPTERNASTITIAPASTSQSIELYLGATGLAFNTSGLAAYYVRNQSAPVAITLVTQTPTGAWTSGGFAEISSSLVPGVYRLDVPNAAFAAGASDVTIVVRGASGTNGAVLTVTLSSGGLTAAQTAAAVWDEPYTSHTTASTFGARTLKTTVDNRNVDVGTSFHIHSNVHAIVDSTAAASELSGALLHNGTDYIDSNLLGGASTRVFVGRFDLRQTGSETVDTIEVFTTDTPSFELQLTDGDGNEVPVTGATLGLRILDVASTVVETGTPTVEYGTGGIVRWTGPGTYLAIGCPAGMYRLFIDRTVSGTTTTFGPLQIKVQAQ